MKVWQASSDFCTKIYHQTDAFPRSEQFGLTAQMRRAAVSIPSNLAEGQKRGKGTEFRQFCRIAYGSAAELETQKYLCREIGFLDQSDYDVLNEDLQVIMRMLNKLIMSLNSQTKT